MILLIALFVFITLLVIAMLYYRYTTANQSIIRSRMRQYVEECPLEKKVSLYQAPAPADAQSGGLRLFVRNMSKHLETLKWSHVVEQQLIQAALPMRGAEFMVICIGMALLSAVILLLLSSSIFLSLMGGIIGFSIPLFILRVKIEQRKKAFNDQLGDTIILIANSLRTGYSFMQSIEMVSREMPKPISEEFARVLKEMNLGVITEDALTNMTKRVKSEDLDLIVTAVLIQRQVGGNLAVILDSIASTIRERVKIQGHIRTLTAQGKISGIIVGMLPVAIGGIIYVINPEYIKILFINPVGKIMLGAGMVSQLIGIMVIRKIITIDI